jgi:hypothetical protein
MTDDELTPEQKFAAEDPEAMVPRALMQGRDPEEIAAELVRLDWSPQAARALVARVADDLGRFHESPASRERLVKEARTQLVAGLLLGLLAAGVTAFTLLAALAGALPFIVVAFGLFFAGLILASRGWARWQLYRGATLPFQPSESDDPGQVEQEAGERKRDNGNP